MHMRYQHTMVVLDEMADAILEHVASTVLAGRTMALLDVEPMLCYLLELVMCLGHEDAYDRLCTIFYNYLVHVSPDAPLVLHSPVPDADPSGAGQLPTATVVNRIESLLDSCWTAATWRT
jgi:hypothetical protein